MPRKPPPFSEDVKIRVLLWCGRHCCHCARFVGTGIELHHIDSERADIDNALPVCFDCHAQIGHYNDLAPRGRKFDPQELKVRRDQIYEQHTRHLVPPIRYAITQWIPDPNNAFNLRYKRREPRDVGFFIKNLGDLHPIQVKVWVTLGQGRESLGDLSGNHYNGNYYWNLNPRAGVSGHFDLPSTASLDHADPVTARIDVRIFDIYKYMHRLLPVGYIYDAANNDWYLEASEELLPPAPRGLPVAQS